MTDREILDRLWEAYRETPFASFSLTRKLDLRPQEHTAVLNLIGDMADSGETQNGYRVHRGASTVYKISERCRCICVEFFRFCEQIHYAKSYYTFPHKSV